MPIPHPGGCVKIDMVYNLYMTTLDFLTDLLKIFIFTIIVAPTGVFIAMFPNVVTPKPPALQSSSSQTTRVFSEKEIDIPKFYYIIDLDTHHPAN